MKPQKKFRADRCSRKNGAGKETDMTTRGRAEARIRRAERIVGFLFDVIVPIFTRARESRRVA